MTKQTTNQRLAYLRKKIENISTAEITELQSLKEYIDPADNLLLEWAGVPEFPEEFEDIDDILKQLWDLSSTEARIHIRALQRELNNNYKNV